MAALLGAGMCATPAGATTFEPISVQQLTDRSELVVRGHVVATEVRGHGPGGLPGIHTEITVAVDEALKGAPGREVHFFVQGGRLGGRLRVVHGQARIAMGEHVIMFLFRNEHGVLWPTGMGRGKWLVRDTPGGPVVRPASPLGGSGDPTLGPPTEAPLAELEAIARGALSGSVRPVGASDD